ncbi:MAG TPA: hypothetical protein VHL30_03520 [Chlamydiales bacterium]|jgi:hypothetical protein|nr:hypothetical protein [Chlamydiales bacterium]
MQKQPVAAVINFCSNESRFIGSCIEEARKFAKQIIVPVCDHFFDGSAENRPLLEQVYRAYPDCLFLEYPFIPSEIPRRIFKDVSPAHFWHSCSRLIGSSYLNEGIEAVLFLDADEIPDGSHFAEWLEASDYQQNTVMKLSNYWYFREPIYQALSWEDSVVLVHTRAITHDLLLRQEERDAIYNLLPGPKRRQVTGSDGQPMFHHFSWVRTKDEMLKKVLSWGHKGDRNWVELVEQEFASDFRGTDFIHGYQYKTVAPLFDIRLEPAIFPSGHREPNVVRLTQKELRDLLKFKKSLLWRWLLSLVK